MSRSTRIRRENSARIEVEFLLDSADRELRETAPDAGATDMRLVLAVKLLTTVTATNESKALEAKLTLLRGRLDELLERECNAVAIEAMGESMGGKRGLRLVGKDSN